MDLTGIQKAVEIVNAKTIPELDVTLQKLAKTLADSLENVLDHLDGATITITIKLKDRV